MVLVDLAQVVGHGRHTFVGDTEVRVQPGGSLETKVVESAGDKSLQIASMVPSMSQRLEYLLEVWYRKHLFQFGQQFPQKDVQSPIVTRPILDWKHLLCGERSFEIRS